MNTQTWQRIAVTAYALAAFCITAGSALAGVSEEQPIAVPEPATLALLAGGFAVAVVLRNRRKK